MTWNKPCSTKVTPWNLVKGMLANRPRHCQTRLVWASKGNGWGADVTLHSQLQPCVAKPDARKAILMRILDTKSNQEEFGPEMEFVRECKLLPAALRWSMMFLDTDMYSETIMCDFQVSSLGTSVFGWQVQGNGWWQGSRFASKGGAGWLVLSRCRWTSSSSQRASQKIQRSWVDSLQSQFDSSWDNIELSLPVRCTALHSKWWRTTRMPKPSPMCRPLQRCLSAHTLLETPYIHTRAAGSTEIDFSWEACSDLRSN